MGYWLAVMDIGSAVNTVWESYIQMQEWNPWVGAVATSAILYPIGDIASQLIEDQTVDWRKVVFTTKLAPFYGLGLEALIQTGDLAGSIIHDNPIVKSALGPNLWGNAFNALFFTNNTVAERTGYKVKELVKHYSNLVRDTLSKKSPRRLWDKIKENIPREGYRNATIGTLTFWNAFHAANYYYIPEAFRTPATLTVGVFWIAGLSWWSLNGRRELVGK